MDLISHYIDQNKLTLCHPIIQWCQRDKKSKIRNATQTIEQVIVAILMFISFFSFSLNSWNLQNVTRNICVGYRC